MREEEKAYVDIFKHPRKGKNRYRIVWYRDRMRRNIAMALMQILWPQRPTYMMTWQVGFIKRALRGDRRRGGSVSQRSQFGPGRQTTEFSSAEEEAISRSAGLPAKKEALN
ncbi:hypothetical protein AXG93_3310s1280 [Marchantia polymorpha subsp. ruderalis]|uniref:Uncharacterized protein n=1 Tax=Marchantia polymorpha subsp. ruderalis TaxID=1480154 RepID=A0A176W119_MARPO|nr:hypothetical protein AXG93_3310s1280 [Marchantia polymorpha subsp. ruderalis]